MKLTEEEKNLEKIAKTVLMNPFIPPEGAMSKEEARKILSKLAMKQLEESTEKI